MVVENLSLLDRLSGRMTCLYLSDLRFLTEGRKVLLAEEIAQIPVGEYTLAVWNDALEYLTGAQPCDNAEQARVALIAGLSEV